MAVSQAVTPPCRCRGLGLALAKPIRLISIASNLSEKREAAFRDLLTVIQPNRELADNQPPSEPPNAQTDLWRQPLCYKVLLPLERARLNLQARQNSDEDP